VNDVVSIRQYYTVESVVLNHSLLTIIAMLESLNYVYGDGCLRRCVAVAVCFVDVRGG
jgi:hypothetical protein